MTPSEAIAHLKKAGMTEKAIAESVNSTQPTINKICSGSLKETSYSLGKALVDLAQGLTATDPGQAEAA